MKLDFNLGIPIFLQISEGIREGILSGVFPEEEQIPSVADFSVRYKINPATALKGINLLVDDNILYKKRGMGMFVKEGAVAALTEKRRNDFYDSYVKGLVDEAKRISIPLEDLIKIINKGYEE